MQIRMVDKSQILASSGDKNTIKVKNHIVPDDVIIVDDGDFDYYKVIQISPTSGETIAVRTPVLGCINAVRLRVFCKMFVSYREIGDMDIILKEFPGLSREKIQGFVLSAIERVEKHKKISREDVLILSHLLVYNKKEKELVDGGICSYDEIDRAYSKFSSEYKWCYGFKKPCIDRRISQIGMGEYTFFSTPVEFADAHNICTEALHNLIRTVMEAASRLELATAQCCTKTAELLVQGKTLSPQEKEELADLVKSIHMYMHQKEKEIYTSYAGELIEKEKTHVSDLMNLSVERGIDYLKLSRAMRKLGVEPKQML